MSMEKRGVIEDGRTPPEDDRKEGQPLEAHAIKRAADEAKDSIRGNEKSQGDN